MYKDDFYYFLGKKNKYEIKVSNLGLFIDDPYLLAFHLSFGQKNNARDF